jgi:two-component system response regulator YesN
MKENSTKIMEDSHQQITGNVQAYIQEHLAEGISLQMIAEHVNLHPVYLSKVYKTVTSETIPDQTAEYCRKRDEKSELPVGNEPYLIHQSVPLPEII